MTQIGNQIVSVGRLHAPDGTDVLRSAFFVFHCGSYALRNPFRPSSTILCTVLLAPCQALGCKGLVTSVAFCELLQTLTRATF